MRIERSRSAVIYGSAVFLAGLFCVQLLLSSEPEPEYSEELRSTEVLVNARVDTAALPPELESETIYAPQAVAIDRTEFSSSTDALNIGEYIDPDRGADFSEPAVRMEIGDYIDPERGPDWSEPKTNLSLGEYIDPDQGAVFQVNPAEALSVGEFIDPDALVDLIESRRLEVGEYRDPDLP